MCFELGVAPGHRRRGIGVALTEAMVRLATELGCYGMWVPIEPDNKAAVATYHRVGAAGPEPATVMSWTLSAD